MQSFARKCLYLIFGLAVFKGSFAQTVTWCVYDFTGNHGMTMQLMRDYAIASKKWGVNAQHKVYSSDQAALHAFQQQQCDGVVASTFLLREYNPFVGTLNAVGLMPNNQVAEQTFMALAHKDTAQYMQYKGYETVGWMPIGSAYFMVKDREINSITELAGRRIGALKEDPSQSRMIRRVGAQVVFINFDNAANFFIDNKVDILPAPIYAYQPFKLDRGLGQRGGVINFPISYISLSAIVRKDAVPKDYGQQSREWFKNNTPKMMRNVLNWEKSMPTKYWYDIPLADRSSYQRLVMQLRKEFIKSGLYHPAAINMVLKLHCHHNPQYFECKKS